MLRSDVAISHRNVSVNCPVIDNTFLFCPFLKTFISEFLVEALIYRPTVNKNEGVESPEGMKFHDFSRS